jgi:hypothetical protein
VKENPPFVDEPAAGKGFERNRKRYFPRPRHPRTGCKNRYIIETSNPPDATKAIIGIGRVLTQTQTLSRTASIAGRGGLSCGAWAQLTDLQGHRHHKKINVQSESNAFPQQTNIEISGVTGMNQNVPNLLQMFS